MKKRILSIIAAAALCVGSMAMMASADGAVQTVTITNAGELGDAIKNQADGQNWVIKSGTYDLDQAQLDKYKDVQLGSQGNWYFPITKKISIKGEGNPVITSSVTSANGAWATQDFLSIWADGVSIDGIVIDSKTETNKAIEVMAKDFTLKNFSTKPKDVSDGKVFSGSVYFNPLNEAKDIGSTTLENVTVQGWISIRPENVKAGKLALKDVTLDFVGNAYAGVDGYTVISSNPERIEAESLSVQVDSTINLQKQVLDAVPAKATVELAAGEYAGALSAKRPMTIAAMQNAKARAVTVPVITGMLSTSSDVVLKGLTFLPAANKIAVYPSAGSLTVDGCTFGAKDKESFSAVYNESPMKSLTFVNNTLNGSFRKALLVHPTETAVISGNTFAGDGDSYGGEAGKTSVMTIVATEDTAVTIKDNEVSNYHKMLSVDNSEAQGTWEIKENKIVDVNYALEMSSEKDFTYDISGNYFEQEGKATEPAVMDAKTGESYDGEAVVTGPYYQDEDMKQLSDKVYSITLDKTSLTLKPGETATLTATVDAGADADKTLTWSTSDAKIATVENGKVTAVKDGKVTITAKAGDVTVTCEVTVAADKPVSEPDTDTPDTGVAFPAAVLMLAAGAAAALAISKKRK